MDASRWSICFDISPLFPKRRIIERESEKGGDMTGIVASVVISFFALNDVLSIRNANRNPTRVENVAVRTPSLRDPHKACR